MALALPGGHSILLHTRLRPLRNTSAHYTNSSRNARDSRTGIALVVWYRTGGLRSRLAPTLCSRQVSGTDPDDGGGLIKMSRATLNRRRPYGKIAFAALLTITFCMAHPASTAYAKKRKLAKYGTIKILSTPGGLPIEVDGKPEC